MIATLILLFSITVFMPLIYRLLNKRMGKVLCFVPSLLLLFYVYLFVSENGASSYDSLRWVSHLGINLDLHMDGLSFFFITLIFGVGTLIYYYADGYFDNHATPYFYMILTLFMASMFGLVISDNIFMMFVFWELTSFSSYLLIGYYHKKEESRIAALQAFLVTGAGGLFLLAGLVIVSEVSGCVTFTELFQNKSSILQSSFSNIIMILMLIGAFTKSAQFPFHFWLPNAMAAPAPVSAFLHSATMVKAGIYLMARIHPLFGDQIMWETIVSFIGCTTMLVCAYLAFQQTYLKKYLAYTTLSALGTITLMLGLGNDKAILAAVTFLAAHAFYKSALFMVAGAVHHKTGESDVNKLGGLVSKMPLIAITGALAAASMAGIPPFLGFIGKELLYEGALKATHASMIVTIAVFISNALIVATAIIVGYQPFWGKLPATGQINVKKGAGSLWLAPAVPAILGLILGLLPGLIIFFFPGPVISSIKPGIAETGLSLWHGLTKSLILDLGALISGILLFKYRHLLQSKKFELPEWIKGETLYFTILNATLGFGRWQTGILQSGHLRYYIKTIVITACLVSGYIIFSRDLYQIVSTGSIDFQIYDIGLALIILIAVLSTLFAQSRLAAVASLGAIGFAVALIFVVFSAPDLAMTQFTIETLMVLLLVLVLYHLPLFSTFTTHKTRILDAFVAIAAGAGMTFLTLVAAQHQFSPPISEYFKQNSLSAHGKNVVNVILVDFRGFDTLGEITVLAVAALGVYALLKCATKSHSAFNKEDIDL